MERHIPKQGEIYRHFKGNLYEVVIIARDSETLEEKVVYKAVDGDAAYVRPLAMFMSPVEKEKYPDVEQEYRFELIEQSAKQGTEKNEVVREEMQDKELILDFLNLENSDEKIEYLLRVKEEITENFIQAVAQSLDFVENAGSLEERYEDILKYLRTLSKFECGRLR